MRTRNAYFDNAKFILIFLVVFGHMISPYRTDSDGMLSIYHFIFIFHMPVFILLAGYFSKNFHKKGYYKKIFTKVALPYLAFQTIYTFYYDILYQNETYTLQYLVPRWAMWFLLSLIFWKLMLPFFAKFPMWLSMTFAILLGLGVGFVNIDGFEKFLSISRMFVFFPFFLLGYYLSKMEEPFKKLMTVKGRFVSATVLFVALVGSYVVLNDTVYTSMLYGTNTYDQSGEFMMRIVHYAIAFAVSFAFMALIPSHEFAFTSVGQRSLYVYLLHGFVLKWFFTTEFAKGLDSTSWGFVVLTILSIVVTLVLGSKLVDVVIIATKLLIKFILPKNSLTKLTMVLKRTFS
ncbi:acyltransferase family protein [Metabacillus iocasae]|uniref:Fucose 4-O-acetylase-like acetyltransferase n=1 Tax=Priestia iocasae TaxID=2291674 RepID=A0ABS2QW03_9BACI|nr:acyltransferase family protein [Metabacillus iocasae]MBM7703177.1 fucose 4-O-acetylase-like acetyltransferase [Metabacillus iocasae]